MRPVRAITRGGRKSFRKVGIRGKRLTGTRDPPHDDRRKIRRPSKKQNPPPPRSGRGKEGDRTRSDSGGRTQVTTVAACVGLGNEAVPAQPPHAAATAPRISAIKPNNA